MRNLTILIIAAASICLLSGSTSLGHIMQSDDCGVGKNPNLSGRNVKQAPDFDFRWESSAASKSVDNEWCYDRYIYNRHSQNALRFDWPIVGMKVVEGLPPGETAHSNFKWRSGPAEPRDGDLKYGNDGTEMTRVYLTPEETARQPSRYGISGTIRMVVLDEKGNRMRIILTMTAVAQPRTRIQYRFVNRGDSIQADWTLSHSPAFYDKASEALATKGKGWDFGKPMPIPEGSLLVNVPITKGGVALILPIRFYSRGGREIASVRIPTIVSE